MTGLNKIFGIQTRHMVDRSGAESFKSLASGTVDVIYETEALSARYGSRGLLRLAPDRSKDPALSYIPSMGDIGQTFYMYTWEGISAPKDTPKHIVKRLSDAIGIVMAQPKTQEMFKQANMSPAYMPSEEFAKFYADTVETFTMLLKEGGVIK